MLCLVITAGITVASTPIGPGEARAEPDAPARSLPRTDYLDGFYVALGPTASAVRAAGAWDGSFGAELFLVQVRERCRLAAAGLGIGVVRYAHGNGEGGLGRGTGRAWVDALLGVGLLDRVDRVVGVSAGMTVELDAVVPPRWGAQATIWTYAGVIPFVRVGTVQKNGTYIDFGIKVALPAIRL